MCLEGASWEVLWPPCHGMAIAILSILPSPLFTTHFPPGFPLHPLSQQYASMLADIGFVGAPRRGGGGEGGGGGGGGGRGRTWMDDRGAAFNRYAAHPGDATLEGQQVAVTVA